MAVVCFTLLQSTKSTSSLQKQARVLGFEPRIVDPKSTALPLGHTRMMHEKRLLGEISIPQACLKQAYPSLSHALYTTRRGGLCQPENTAPPRLALDQS